MFLQEDDFLSAFRAGEESAFDQVFRKYFGPLTFYAHTLVHDERSAEDIVQDCFVELWQRRRKLNSVVSINSYLYRCVHNKALLYLKTNGKKLPGELAIDEKNIEESIIASEIIGGIMKVVETLPDRMRQVVQMYYLEEKSYQEIGDSIGIDPETVRSHRYRAINLIRKTIIPS